MRFIDMDLITFDTTDKGRFCNIPLPLSEIEFIMMIKSKRVIILAVLTVAATVFVIIV